MLTRTLRRASAFALCLGGAAFLPACAQPSGSIGGPASGEAKLPAWKAELTAFLDIRAPFGGQLSPEGTLYYIKRADRAYQLFRRPAGRGGTTEQVTDFEDGISGFSLSPDGKNLVIGAGVGGDEQLDLYLRSTATSQIRPLLVDRGVVYASVLWKRDSSGFAYRANDRSPREFYVYDYDLASGKTRLLFESEGANYPADWSGDGSRLIVGKYNSNSYQQVFEVDTATREFREVTPPGVRRRFAVVGYNAEETGLVVSTDYLGNFTNLAVLNLESGQVSAILAEFAGNDVDTAELNEDRTILAAVINRDGYGHLVLRSMKDMSPIEGPGPRKGLIGGLRFTGDTMLFAFYDARCPGTIFSWKVSHAKRPARALAEPDDGGIDLDTLARPRLVRYRSFDGMEIPAFLYLPRDAAWCAPSPFIVFFHGGPEGQARPGFRAALQYFVSRGFGVLQPNVRGSSGYGTEYMNLDNYEKRMDSVKDGLAGARWLIDQGYTRAGRLGAYGGSYGGFMVMAAITEAPELFAAACDVVGIVNFETFLTNTKSYRRHLREAEYGPLSDPGFLRSISPIHQVERIRTPLLVVHGRNDPRVPVTEAEQIGAALTERGLPVELLIFEDEGHGIRKQPNRMVYYKKMAEFFERHLKG